MRGWRDGGKTRWWEWPVRLVSTARQRVRTMAALEDLEVRSDPRRQARRWATGI